MLLQLLYQYSFQVFMLKVWLININDISSCEKNVKFIRRNSAFWLKALKILDISDYWPGSLIKTLLYKVVYWCFNLALKALIFPSVD